MKLSGDYLIPASQDRVWEALNDPEILKQSIPGCESIDKVSDTEMDAAVEAAVGPVKAKFKGKVNLSNLEPPHSYTLSGEGKGGAAGFAKGSANVSLTPENGGTKLHYEVDATVGGKLAQIGQRFIDATAKKMADDFFETLSDLASDGKGAIKQEAPAETSEAPPREQVPALIWIVALTAAVGLLIFVTQAFQP